MEETIVQQLPWSKHRVDEALLSIRDVWIEYQAVRGAVKAVRGVHFDIFPGESMALIGESGCGKTTLGLGIIRLLVKTADIVRGKRAITADTALRLGKYFGVSPELWLNLQTDFDLRVAKLKIWPKVERRIRPLRTV